MDPHHAELGKELNLESSKVLMVPGSKKEVERVPGGLTMAGTSLNFQARIALEEEINSIESVRTLGRRCIQ